MKPSISSPRNNWYVITGAPSAGKSTVIARLRAMGYATFEEMGRKLIDRELADGKTLQQIHVDSPEFEMAWVQMQHDAEERLDKEQTIFFDRGVFDTLAYFEHYGWPVPAKIRQWCRQAAYRKVFVLEILDYEQDYARVESAETAQRMQALFEKVYHQAGYDVVVVPRDTVENRVQLIRKSLL